MSIHEAIPLSDFERLRERVRREDNNSLEQLIDCESSFLSSVEKKADTLESDSAERREVIELRTLIKKRLGIILDEKDRRNHSE